MNIFEALRESHVIQRNLAERLLQTSGDTPERRELFERLKNELFAHAVAEDRYFYIPLMMTDSGLNITRHALAEHHKMDELLEQFDGDGILQSGLVGNCKKIIGNGTSSLTRRGAWFFSASRKNLTRCSKDCARQAVSAGIQKVQKN